MHRDLYVVVAVNPQDVFHEVGLAPHVDAVRRYADLPCAIAFRFDRHAERVDDFSDGRLRDRFADQPWLIYDTKRSYQELGRTALLCKRIKHKCNFKAENVKNCMKTEAVVGLTHSRVNDM